MTGFNPDEVVTAINAVISSYNELINSLGNRVQTEFVGGMADKWCCSQAQKYFNNVFKPEIDNLLMSVDRIFESVIASMNSAAQAWANATSTSYSSIPFSPNGYRINVSNILENINGVRGIEIQATKSVVNVLNSIANDCDMALSKAQNSVNSCGFIGGTQYQNLLEALTTIKTRISSGVSEMILSVQNAINETISQYSNTAGAIQSAFIV